MTSSEIKRKAVRLLAGQDFSGMFGLYFLNLTRLKIGHRTFITTVEEFEKTHPGLSADMGDQCTGAAVTVGGKHFIFYDPRRDDGAFSLLHEVGHILLGHCKDGTGDTEEREAEQFACEFLMPECVIRYLDARNGKALSPEKFGMYFKGGMPMHLARRLEIDRRPPENPDENENEIVRRLFAAEGNQ